MNQTELDNLWFSFQAIPGVRFKLNDAVQIKSGEHGGKFGSVISLVSTDPIPTYVIELGSGDAEVEMPESDLAPVV